MSAGFTGPSTRADWQPNFIDWRHSLVMADRRRDAGEDVPECELQLVGFPAGVCCAELDVRPVPHHPRCPAVVEEKLAARICVEPGCDRPIEGGKAATLCAYHRRIRTRRVK